MRTSGLEEKVYAHVLDLLSAHCLCTTVLGIHPDRRDWVHDFHALLRTLGSPALQSASTEASSVTLQAAEWLIPQALRLLRLESRSFVSRLEDAWPCCFQGIPGRVLPNLLCR